MSNYVNLFKYPGNKMKFLDAVIPLINTADCSTYIEPFLGSGVIYLNAKSNRYIVNDTFTVYTDILKMFGSLDYQSIEVFYDFILKNFGNIGKNKESYYKFRDYVNKLDDSIEKKLGIFYLSRSCINSMVRFGPNGFNQGFGNRCGDIFLTRDDLEFINNKLKTTVILNTDYKNLIKYNNIDDVIWVLDPPYVDSPIDIYHNNFNYSEFKDFASTLNGKILYFDTENDFGDSFFPYKIILRTMKSISPKSKHQTKVECLYHNIDFNTLF